ncbi:hypothetical protein H4I96_09691 [Botrytis cinerea]
MESSPTMAKTDSLKRNIDTDAKNHVDGTCVSEMTGTVLEIDPKKEAAALRKFDKYVLPVSVIFLVLSTLDRNNLGNARTFGFDEDVGLKSGEFGNITTLSSVCTIIFELPWVLAVRRFGANKAIGTAFVLWSACTLGTAFIHTYAQAIVVRMILNAAEAGLAQGFAFLFSTIYPRESAGKHYGARRGLAAWRWLFIVEFCITILICGIGWIFLPNSVETAWFLNEEEKETMRLKKIRDFAIRGEEKFDRKWIKIALADPFVYLLGIAFFTSSVAINGFGVFLPTILSGLGYNSLAANYMTIPIYVVGLISLIIQVYFSDKYKKRGVFIVACCVPVAVGYLICVGTPSNGAGYAGMFILVLGLYPISTLAVTWISTNLSPDDKRSIGMPIAYSIANVSSLVSSQLYPTQQGPRYIVGNSVSAGLTVVAGFLYGACWFLLRRRNSKKEKLIAEGATTNGLKGDMSLDSMYIL